MGAGPLEEGRLQARSSACPRRSRGNLSPPPQEGIAPSSRLGRLLGRRHDQLPDPRVSPPRYRAEDARAPADEQEESSRGASAVRGLRPQEQESREGQGEVPCSRANEQDRHVPRRRAKDRGDHWDGGGRAKWRWVWGREGEGEDGRAVVGVEWGEGEQWEDAGEAEPRWWRGWGGSGVAWGGEYWVCAAQEDGVRSFAIVERGARADSCTDGRRARRLASREVSRSPSRLASRRYVSSLFRSGVWSLLLLRSQSKSGLGSFTPWA